MSEPDVDELLELVEDDELDPEVVAWLLAGEMDGEPRHTCPAPTPLRA